MARKRLSVAPEFLEGERLTGLGHIPGFLSAEDQELILAELRNACRRHRPVKEEFGSFQVLDARQFPVETSRLASRIGVQRLLCGTPSRAQVNWYEPGKGIYDHVDMDDIRDGAVLTLGAGCVIHFRRSLREEICTRLLLRPGDLYVMRDEARDCAHGIVDAHADDFRGRTHPRTGERTALVFATTRLPTEKHPKSC
jgi:hypothetical protein